MESIPIVQIFIFVFVGFVTYGLFLGFTKQATFYEDFNDLGLSAIAFAGPVVVSIVLLQLGLNSTVTLVLSVSLLLVLSYYSAKTTFRSNSDKPLHTTIILVISKLFMSFLYIFYLYQAMTDKDRGARRKAWFVLVVLTPVLLLLVKNHEGRFTITSSGRPRIN